MSLWAKLEVLVEEVTELVREERKRRSAPVRYQAWLGNHPDVYGPNGTEIRFGGIAKSNDP